ncbi:MAG: NAD(P)-dependent oxidoreductase, partial [Betaproteobacteria bacterium]|nr:NAD(P)-dependent oxidoreductase [Betaproteobacteria bacterium]
MGMGVARSLLRAGFTVAACDVREEARRDRNRQRLSRTIPRRSRRSSAIVITLVVSAEPDRAGAVRSRRRGRTLAPGSAVIASATVPPEFAIPLGGGWPSAAA